MDEELLLVPEEGPSSLEDEKSDGEDGAATETQFAASKIWAPNESSGAYPTLSSSWGPAEADLQEEKEERLLAAGIFRSRQATVRATDSSLKSMRAKAALGSVLLTAMLLGAAIARRRLLLMGTGRDPLAFLSADPLSVQEREFNQSVLELQQAWAQASESSRRVFAERYSPRGDGGLAESNPIALYQWHLEAFHDDERPGILAAETEKVNYRLSRCLFAAILHVAARRISSLTELEEATHAQRPALPSVEALKAQTDDLVDFSEFTSMLKGINVDMTECDKARGKQIPRVLAEALARHVMARHEQLRNDMDAATALAKAMQHINEELLAGDRQSPSEDVLLPMPLGIAPFRPLMLNFALKLFTLRRENQSLLPTLVGSWAANWTVEGVLDQCAALQAVQLYLPDEEFRIKQVLRAKAEKRIKPGEQTPDTVFLLGLALL